MFDQMLGKLQDMQQKMDQLKERLDRVTVTGDADGVVVTMNANRKMVNIDLADSLVAAADKEQLEDLIMVAVNRAMVKAQEVSDAEGAALSRDVLPGGLPGMFG